MYRCALIICWIGKLPKYFSIFLKTCALNPDFDFFVFTDDTITLQLPPNVKFFSFSMDELIHRIQRININKYNIKRAYRICDFRPMFGMLFANELKGYTHWGYCDLDLVFGRISDFVTEDLLKHEAVFNAGHFTLIQNNDKLNNLYKCDGGLFPYSYVVKTDGIFAFDETTGIQRIAKNQNIDAVYGIPYIETEIKYHQLRSRSAKNNPDYQCFYWENGTLYRCKYEDEDIKYQTFAYIHLQKRKLDYDDDIEEAFWITPNGYKKKSYIGAPTIEDIKKYNPYEGTHEMELQRKAYRRKKIKELILRKPKQIYIRLRQEMDGINRNDNSQEELEWKRF